MGACSSRVGVRMVVVSSGMTCVPAVVTGARLRAGARAGR